MSSIAFDGYHSEFQSLTTQIQQALQQNTHATDESIDSLFTQSSDILKQMSIEARGIKNDEMKQELLAKVRMGKSQLAALHQDYTCKVTSSEKSSLFTNKERLYKNEEHAQQQSDTLDRALMTMADTEQVATEISSELSRNRETLERSQANVNHLSNMTDKAAQLIKRMSRRRGIKD